MTDPIFPVLGAEHGYLLGTLVLLALQIFVYAVLAGRVRGQVFSKKFIDDKFGDLHFKQTQNPVPVGGYPDMGCGRYSDELSYYDWFRLNNAQRNHANYLENFPLMVISLLVAGIYYPLPATGISLIIFVARIMYAFYLTTKGSSSRVRGIGSALSSLGLLAAFVFAFLSVHHLIQLPSAYGDNSTTTPTEAAGTQTVAKFLSS